MKKRIFYIIPILMLLCLCNQPRSGNNSKAKELIKKRSDLVQADTLRTPAKNSIKNLGDTLIQNSKQEAKDGIPRNAIFIDPSYSGPEKGTEKQPFRSFDKVDWKDGIYVVLKRGSQMITASSIRPEADNILIGAYGKGKRPLIKSTLGGDKKIMDLGGLANVTIRDIEIESLNDALTCFHFYNSKGGRLINCKVHGSQWGIRNLHSSGTFEIINCEVSNTGDDGIFIKDLDTIMVSGCHIFDVNLKYHINPSEKFSGGDCIQLYDTRYFTIVSNNLDHGSTGNKFCFISNNEPQGRKAHGIIERNILSRNDSGILIYLDVAENIVIKQNKFVNAEIAIYNHSTGAKIYYNEFINITGNVFMIDTRGSGIETLIFNNTLVNFNNLSNRYREKIKFFNNIFYKNKGTMFIGISDFKPENNCYYNVNLRFGDIDNKSISEDPLFKDPEKSDYSLKPNSPCINRGSVSGENYSDIIGNEVPHGNTCDIGAHKFKK